MSYGTPSPVSAPQLHTPCPVLQARVGGGRHNRPGRALHAAPPGPTTRRLELPDKGAVPTGVRRRHIVPLNGSSFMHSVYSLVREERWLEAEQQCNRLRKALPYYKSFDVAVLLASILFRQGAHRVDEALSILCQKHTFLDENGRVSLLDDVDTNILMVRLLQKKKLFTPAQIILKAQQQQCHQMPLLAMDTPCGKLQVDLAMVDLLFARGESSTALNLLQAMRKRSCERNTLALDTPCGHRRLDLAMVRLLGEKGDFPPAFTLLQTMRRNHCGNGRLMLDVPCNGADMDIAMVRLLEGKREFSLATVLLHTMRLLHCGNNRLAVDAPCNDLVMDLAMVGLLEKRSSLTSAITLLQGVRKQLCRNVHLAKDEPCGRYNADTAMERLLRKVGESTSADTLSQAMYKHCSGGKPSILDRPKTDSSGE